MAWYDRILGRRKEGGLPYQIQNESRAYANKYDYSSLHSAVELAALVDTGQRYQLIDLYNNTMRDPVVLSASEARTNRVVLQDYKLVDTEGNVVEEYDSLCKKAWFLNLLKEAHQSIYFGYSLASLIWINKEIVGCRSIDRRNCNPDKRRLYKHYTNADDGVPIDDYPLDLVLCELTERNIMHGLLQPVSSIVKRKRYQINTRDRAQEKQALPLLVAKIENTDLREKQSTSDMLDNLGTSGHMVVPTGCEVDVLDSSKNGLAYFNQNIEYSNKEIILSFLGQTMTTEDGSSRSQAEVHERKEDTIVENDTNKVVAFLNNQLLPILIAGGYAIKEDMKFEVRKSPSREERKEQALELLRAGVKLDIGWLEDEFGVKVDIGAMHQERAMVGGVVPNGKAKERAARYTFQRN